MTKVIELRMGLIALISLASLAWPSNTLSANDWPDASPALMTVLIGGQQKAGSTFSDIQFSAANRTANGFSIKMFSKSDPLSEWKDLGQAYVQVGWSYLNGQWSIDSSQPWIAITQACEELLEANDANTSEWVECLATTAHELNHIAFGEWKTQKCISEATAAGGSFEEQEAMVTDCLSDFSTWDDCMRMGDDSGRNLIDESWSAYKNGLCLCKKACDAPAGSDLQNSLLDQANSELSDASDFWMAGQDLAGNPSAEPPIAGCGPSPTGLPPLGTPASSSPDFGTSGPGATSCDCNAPIEFDPCADTPDPSAS